MKKFFIAIMAIICFSVTVSAQTKDELKAERQAIKTEIKSKEMKKTNKTFDKIAPVGGTMEDIIALSLHSLPAVLKSSVTPALTKLATNAEVRTIAKPTTTGLASVDGLVDAGGSLLAIVVATNSILSEYKIAIEESGDGEIDITKFTANADDYAAIMPLLVQASADAAKAAAKVKDVQTEVKALNPMQAMPTINASAWAIDAVNVSAAKIGENTKLLQNLINSIKASKNL